MEVTLVVVALVELDGVGDVTVARGLVRVLLVVRLLRKICHAELDVSKRAVLGQVLVVHALKHKRFPQRVNCISISL